MGLTYILSIARRTETASIADLESSDESGSVPLRTYGPYRSEYGRLGEFPNLPPLLVRCEKSSPRGIFLAPADPARYNEQAVCN